MTTDAQPAVAYRVTGRITTRTARGLRIGLTVLASSRAEARWRADRYLTRTRGAFRWDRDPTIKRKNSRDTALRTIP